MLKVYLVDDEQPIIDELLKIIDWKGLGYEICGYSTTAEKALFSIEQKEPHLLICDINMPGMNGLELVQEVYKRKPSTHIILLTAYDLFDYAIQAIKLKVHSYLIKPVNKKEINQILGEIRREISNSLFNDFFTMLIRGKADEEIIKFTEKASRDIGVIQSEKEYCFAFNDKLHHADNILAQYKTKEGYYYLLMEMTEETLEEDSSILYGEKFKGGNNYFKFAKRLFEDAKNLAVEKEKQKDIGNVIKRIIEDIEKEYPQKISLTLYAERYHYNLSYLSKQFKLTQKMNFVDWLLIFRLNKAKQLMTNHSWTLTDIAFKVGYDDYSHFCRAFKKREGMSPQEYRINYC